MISALVNGKKPNSRILQSFADIITYSIGTGFNFCTSKTDVKVKNVRILYRSWRFNIVLMVYWIVIIWIVLTRFWNIAWFYNIKERECIVSKTATYRTQGSLVSHMWWWRKHRETVQCQRTSVVSDECWLWWAFATSCVKCFPISWPYCFKLQLVFCQLNFFLSFFIRWISFSLLINLTILNW